VGCLTADVTAHAGFWHELKKENTMKPATRFLLLKNGDVYGRCASKKDALLAARKNDKFDTSHWVIAKIVIELIGKDF
jgi:hypothetical protein